MTIPALAVCPFCAQIHTFTVMTDVHYGKCLGIVCKGKVLLSAYSEKEIEWVAAHWNDRPLEDKLRADYVYLSSAAKEIRDVLSMFIEKGEDVDWDDLQKAVIVMDVITAIEQKEKKDARKSK